MRNRSRRSVSCPLGRGRFGVSRQWPNPRSSFAPALDVHGGDIMAASSAVRRFIASTASHCRRLQMNPSRRFANMSRKRNKRRLSRSSSVPIRPGDGKSGRVLARGRRGISDRRRQRVLASLSRAPSQILGRTAKDTHRDSLPLQGEGRIAAGPRQPQCRDGRSALSV
jgi:hypothetical protein